MFNKDAYPCCVDTRVLCTFKLLSLTLCHRMCQGGVRSDGWTKHVGENLKQQGMCTFLSAFYDCVYLQLTAAKPSELSYVQVLAYRDVVTKW